MDKISYVFAVLAAGIIAIVSLWTCEGCGEDNPEVREICWWCGKTH